MGGVDDVIYFNLVRYWGRSVYRLYENTLFPSYVCRPPFHENGSVRIHGHMVRAIACFADKRISTKI
jgi:hypothetical protein